MKSAGLCGTVSGGTYDQTSFTQYCSVWRMMMGGSYNCNNAKSSDDRTNNDDSSNETVNTASSIPNRMSSIPSLR